MSGLNVRLTDGTTVSIQIGETFEDIRKKLNLTEQSIFNGIDKDSDQTLDANEVNELKTKLEEANYEVALAPDGNTPRKAYNNALQNMSQRYDKNTLEGNFQTDDNDKWEVKYGDTLWGIAKKTLEAEGLSIDARSINNRIAQIAKLNDINDVNNLRIGTKLIYKLTEAGVQKVNEAQGDSAAAFGGAAPRVVKDGGAAGKRSKNAPASGRGTDTVSVESPIKDMQSTIKVTPNGLNMGSGMPVDKDGNELKKDNGEPNYSDPKFKADGSIMKYTSDETVMYQTIYDKNAGNLLSEVKLSAASIEGLKDLEKQCNDTAAKIQAVADSDSDEVKAQKRANNLAALKELVTITGGNVQVIKNVAEKLRDDNFVDRTSDDYKAFVQDLILTRNADVLRGLFYEGSGKYTAVLTNDKTAHEYLAGVYQEIRAKEKAGEKLTDEEIELKDVVVAFKGYNGYKIEADADNGVHEKYMSYVNMDGTPMYQANINGSWYYAQDPAVLDEFLTKLEAAGDDDNKKAALFTEYANTTDPELAKCLASRAQDLKASNEDMIALVNSHGLEVIYYFDSSVDYDKSVVDAVVARAKEIYTTDKGNLENAVYLQQVTVWIGKVELTEEEKAAVTTGEDQTQEQAEKAALKAKREQLKAEIAETYFESTTAEGDTKTYTFNPSRIPTKEEAGGLLNLPLAFNEALVKYTKLEDMGKGRYNECIESAWDGRYTVPRYAEMVAEMTDKEKVLDFIDNNIACDKDYHIPFDKILEKFPNDVDIKMKLFKNVNGHSTISDANRVVLAKQFMTVDNSGNFTFDPKKLPAGVSIDDVIEVLPYACSEDGAAKAYDAILNSFTKVPDDGDESLNKLLGGHYRDVPNAPKNKEKLMNLVDTIQIGSANGNQLIDQLRWHYNLSEDDKAKLYLKCSDAMKRQMIYSGYTKNGALKIVKKGETIDTMVKNYLREHLDKFPQLKKSVESDSEKWTPARITEALDDYLKDFRQDILSDLGISDPKSLIAGKTIIDFDKIKWEERQPGWWNYNFTY